MPHTVDLVQCASQPRPRARISPGMYGVEEGRCRLRVLDVRQVFTGALGLAVRSCPPRSPVVSTRGTGSGRAQRATALGGTIPGSRCSMRREWQLPRFSIHSPPTSDAMSLCRASSTYSSRTSRTGRASAPPPLSKLKVAYVIESRRSVSCVLTAWTSARRERDC